MPIFEDLLALTSHELFSTIFLPFIVVFVIFFGALSALRIFSKKINLVLSLALTVAAGYGGAFAWFSSYIMPFGAYFGVIAFAAVFVIGIAVWAVGRGRDIYYESDPFKKKEYLNKQIAKHQEKMQKAIDKGDKARAAAEYETIKRLQMERDITG